MSLSYESVNDSLEAAALCCTFEGRTGSHLHPVITAPPELILLDLLRYYYRIYQTILIYVTINSKVGSL